MIRFVAKETGIRLPEANYRQVRSFITERLATLYLHLEGYLAHIKQHNDEYARFLDSITVNETYFFREEKHFELLDTLVFPQYKSEKRKKLNFWSAACSSGEEAVSIAALAEKFWGNAADSTYAVFASDINPYVLARLKKGEFKTNSFREDGSSFHPLLESFVHRHGKVWTLEDALKQKIRIQQMNLFQRL